jgi:hypothetical protein
MPARSLRECRESKQRAAINDVVVDLHLAAAPRS